MPCQMDFPTPYAGTNDNTDKLKKKNSSLEVMLCSACRTLESYNFDFDTNPQLSVWWHKHKEEDEARKEKEAKDKFKRNYLINLINTKKVNELSKKEIQELKAAGYL